MTEILHINCPTCGKRLRVPATLSGTTGRCPGCKASVPIDYEAVKSQDKLIVEAELVNSVPIRNGENEDDREVFDFLRDIMTAEELRILQVASMTPLQRKTLSDWGMGMFGLGKHKDSFIDSIKFDGRLIVLQDGSKWEVDSSDAYTADSWTTGDRVVVIDGEMFLLENTEKVDVEEYED
jgi:hypothetical protein